MYSTLYSPNAGILVSVVYTFLVAFTVTETVPDFPLNWTITDRMPEGVMASATVCAYDLCYIIGGAVARKGTGPEEWDWSCIPNVTTINITSGERNYEIAPTVKGRCFGRAAVVFDQPLVDPLHYFIYLFGGQQGVQLSNPDGDFSAVPYTERYDPYADYWEIVPGGDMPKCYNPEHSDRSLWEPYGGVSHTTSVVVNTTIFVFGGGHYTYTDVMGTTRCSFVLETSNPNPSWMIVNSEAGERMPYHTANAAAAVFNNTMYMFGGNTCAYYTQGNINCTSDNDDDQPHELSPYNHTLIFDYSVGLARANGNLSAVNWTELGTATWIDTNIPLFVPRDGLEAIVDEENGLMISLGGYFEEPVGTAEVFNGSHWILATPLYQERVYPGAASITYPEYTAYGKQWLTNRQELRKQMFNGSALLPIGIVVGGYPYTAGPALPLSEVEYLMG